MNFLRRLFGLKSPPAEEQARRDLTLQEETARPEAPTIEAEPVVEETPPGPPAEPVSAAGEEPVGVQARIETAPLDNVKVGDTGPLTPAQGVVGATRQLPTPEEIVAISNSALIYGHCIAVGQVRSNNQDAVAASAVVMRCADSHADFGLFAVADGMGGHLDGEKASAQVVATVTQHVTEQVYLPLLEHGLETSRSAEASERTPINEALIRALQAANAAIIARIPNSGTTATLAVIVGNSLHLAHVGDSRAYIITQRGIEQLTRDHSLAQRLFEVGQLSHDEMMTFPRRNELYKVLGFTEDVEPDVTSRRLPPGSYLLLCSDGLWGEVPDAIIHSVVLTAPTPQLACERLVELANERGGHDNISVIVVQLPIAAAPPHG